MMSRIWVAHTYCLSTGRWLIVDTSKAGWFKDDLMHYATFNLPMMYRGTDVSDEITRVLNDDSHTVVPAAMHGKRSEDINFKDEEGVYNVVDDGRLINLDIALDRDYTETVICYAAHGGSIHTIEMYHVITFSESVIDLVTSRYLSLTEQRSRPYLAVHLRNTDIQSNIDEFLEENGDRISQYPGAVFVAGDHAATLQRVRELVNHALLYFHVGRTSVRAVFYSVTAFL